MEEIFFLMNQMKEKLESASAFLEAEVRMAYSLKTAGAAILVPTILLEQGAVTVKGGALGDFLSGGRGKKAVAAVKFSIFAPLTSGAETCTSLLSSLCQELLFDSSFGIVSITAGAVKVNAEKRAYELTATASFETEIFCKAEQEGGTK